MSRETDGSLIRKINDLGCPIRSTPQHFLQPLALASSGKQQVQPNKHSPSGSPVLITTSPASKVGCPNMLSKRASPCSTAPATSPGAATAQEGRDGSAGHVAGTLTTSYTPLHKASRVTSPYAWSRLPPLSRSCTQSALPYLDVNSTLSAIPRSQHQSAHNPGSSSPSSPLSRSRGNISYNVADVEESIHPNRSSPACPAVTSPDGHGNSSWAHIVKPAVSANQHQKPASNKTEPASDDCSCSHKQGQNRALPGQLPRAGHGSCRGAALARVRRHRRIWDSNTNPAIEPSFEAALDAWQEEVDRGVYGPKFLGSLDAVMNGHITSAMAGAQNFVSSTGSAAGGAAAGRLSSDLTAAAAVFQGSGEEAIQALEGLVQRRLVSKPCLTVMQLQRGVRALSSLESQYQLAAIGVLLKGGCWTAAMQVAHADLSVLAEVLLEMRAIVEEGLLLQDREEHAELAAATWLWAAVDRDMFMKSFRGIGLIQQYNRLRKQLVRWQGSRPDSLSSKTGQMTLAVAPQSVAKGVCNTGASAGANGRLDSCHPELARAERLLLLNVIGNYLAHVDATIAAQATSTAADQPQQQEPQSILLLVDEGQHTVAASSMLPRSVSRVSTTECLDGEVHTALQITEDWQVVAASVPRTAEQPVEQSEQVQQRQADAKAVDPGLLGLQCGAPAQPRTCSPFSAVVRRESAKVSAASVSRKTSAVLLPRRSRSNGRQQTEQGQVMAHSMLSGDNVDLKMMAVDVATLGSSDTLAHQTNNTTGNRHEAANAGSSSSANPVNRLCIQDSAAAPISAEAGASITHSVAEQAAGMLSLIPPVISQQADRHSDINPQNQGTKEQQQRQGDHESEVLEDALRDFKLPQRPDNAEQVTEAEQLHDNPAEELCASSAASCSSERISTVAYDHQHSNCETPALGDLAAGVDNDMVTIGQNSPTEGQATDTHNGTAGQYTSIEGQATDAHSVTAGQYTSTEGQATDTHSVTAGQYTSPEGQATDTHNVTAGQYTSPEGQATDTHSVTAGQYTSPEGQATDTHSVTAGQYTSTEGQATDTVLSDAHCLQDAIKLQTHHDVTGAVTVDTSSTSAEAVVVSAEEPVPGVQVTCATVAEEQTAAPQPTDSGVTCSSQPGSAMTGCSLSTPDAAHTAICVDKLAEVHTSAPSDQPELIEAGVSQDVAAGTSALEPLSGSICVTSVAGTSQDGQQAHQVACSASTADCDEHELPAADFPAAGGSMSAVLAAEVEQDGQTPHAAIGTEGMQEEAGSMWDAVKDTSTAGCTVETQISSSVTDAGRPPCAEQEQTATVKPESSYVGAVHTDAESTKLGGNQETSTPDINTRQVLEDPEAELADDLGQATSVAHAEESQAVQTATHHQGSPSSADPHMQDSHQLADTPHVAVSVIAAADTSATNKVNDDCTEQPVDNTGASGQQMPVAFIGHDGRAEAHVPTSMAGDTAEGAVADQQSMLSEAASDTCHVEDTITAAHQLSNEPFAADGMQTVPISSSLQTQELDDVEALQEMTADTLALCQPLQVPKDSEHTPAQPTKQAGSDARQQQRTTSLPTAHKQANKQQEQLQFLEGLKHTFSTTATSSATGTSTMANSIAGIHKEMEAATEHLLEVLTGLETVVKEISGVNEGFSAAEPSVSAAASEQQPTAALADVIPQQDDKCTRIDECRTADTVQRSADLHQASQQLTSNSPACGQIDGCITSTAAVPAIASYVAEVTEGHSGTGVAATTQAGYASISRPASAATSEAHTATAGSSLGLSSSRPRSGRPQSASCSIRPNVYCYDTAAASKTQNRPCSRPYSAGSDGATEAGLQRFRNSCAEQRLNMELLAQKIMETGIINASAAAEHEMYAHSHMEVVTDKQSGNSMTADTQSGVLSQAHKLDNTSIAQPRSNSQPRAGDVLTAADTPTITDNSEQLAAQISAGPRTQVEDDKIFVAVNVQQHQQDAMQTPGSETARAVVAGDPAGVAAAGTTQETSLRCSQEIPSMHQSRVQSAQQRLPEEVQRTMQLFQQRLEQTALMAQQLLEQQVAGQAACSTSRTSNSRPVSAALSLGVGRGSGQPTLCQPGLIKDSRPGTAPLGAALDDDALQSAAASTEQAKEMGISTFKLTAESLASLEAEEAPTAAEVKEYALYLGMDPEQDGELLYIAELALTAPCPDAWTVHLDKDGNEFFYNTVTQATTYEHPMDQHYRQMYQQKKQEMALK